MSYQFEDESALEELLNQQLDRRKRQPLSISSQQQQASSRPSTTTTATKTTPALVSQQSRPSTAILSNKQSNLDEPTGQKSKLFSWLEGKTSSNKELAKLDADRPFGVESTINFSSKQETVLKSDANFVALDEDRLDEMLKEEVLQDMSKQRLIQLILSQILPVVKSLRQAVEMHPIDEVEQLKKELDTERRRLQSFEATHLEQIKLEQQKWAQITEQLESRLEFSERELNRVLDSQREHLNKIDEHHQKDLIRLSENFETKLANERHQFEETLKRRDEMHRLELESQLRVNCNLVKLDTIQSEWTKTIEMTIDQLEGHFKTVEGLLDKQTIQVNGTNLDLAQKTKHLSEQYDKFEHCNEKVSQLADNLSLILPKFSHLQEQSEFILKQTCEKLAEFNQRDKKLQAKEEELEQIRLNLSNLRDKLNDERFKFALDSNRITLKEERLNELLRINTEMENKLNEQRSNQIEREIQLQSTRSSLDVKASELRGQNYDLHLLRKRLTNEKEELIKAKMDLASDKKSLKNQLAELNDETRKLSTLKEQVNQELDQLRRLQESLVCSLCLSRLFSTRPEQVVNRNCEVSCGLEEAHYGGNYDVDLGELVGQDKFELQMVPKSCGRRHKKFSNTTIGRLVGAKGSVKQLATSFEPLPSDLDNLSEQVERDKHQLACESKYAKLISTTS